MKAGKFNIHDYLGKLYENVNEEDFNILNEEAGELPDSEGIIIPEENKKAYNWLKKEYQKGKTEVKVEMSSHDFKPGYFLQDAPKGTQGFPGMYGQVKTSDMSGAAPKSTPFPETNFPSGKTKADSGDKKDNESSESEDKEDKKQNGIKVEAKTKEDKKGRKKAKNESSGGETNGTKVKAKTKEEEKEKDQKNIKWWE